MSGYWTDAKVQALKDMWNRGLSASLIASRMGGVSRNSVIGKIRRLGLSGRGSGSEGRRRAKESMRRSRHHQPSVTKNKTKPAARKQLADPNSGGLQYHLLTPDATLFRPRTFDEMSSDRSACKWPLLRSTGLFCGDKHTDGRYCDAHQWLSLRKNVDD